MSRASPHGYGALFPALARSLDLQLVRLRLRTVIRNIFWRRGEVRVEATGVDGEPFRGGSGSATAAIATARFSSHDRRGLATYWSRAPLHVPVLTAWSGDSTARRLAKWYTRAPLRARCRSAFAAVKALFG